MHITHYAMSAVLKKAQADILSRPLISLLIIVTVAACSTLLTLGVATLMNLSAPYERVFENLQGAHVWLHLDRALMGPRDHARIQGTPGVLKSTDLYYEVVTRADMGDNQVMVSVRALPDQTPEVNRLLVRKGRYPAPRQMELLVSTDLEDLHKLNLGEYVEIRRSDGRVAELPVVGFAFNPMWDTYGSSHPPYVYVSRQTLREIHPDTSSWQWSMGLRLADPQSVDQIVEHIESTVHQDVIQSYTDWRDVKKSAVFGAQMNVVFLGAFGLFAILATALVVASSTNSAVLSQFRQIGILKALGFTGRQIVCLYLTEYTTLSLVGSSIGFLLGVALSPLPLKSVAVSLNTTYRPPLSPGLAALVLGGVTAVVISATLAAACRGARANIIESINVGAEAPQKNPAWGVALTAELGLPIVLGLGLNDLVVRPLRSLMTGLNLTLGVVGIVFGLALNDTLALYRAQPALLGLAHDAMVTRRETGDRKTRHLLNRAEGVQAFYRQAVLEAETPHGESLSIKAVDGDLEAFPFIIEEGRLFQPNQHEAIAGKGLLDRLGIDVGDELTVVFDCQTSRPVTWTIVGQYPEPTRDGEVLMVSMASPARWARQAEADSYFLRLTEASDTTALKRYLKNHSGDDLNFMLVEQAIPDDVIYLQLAIFALSAVLMMVALINVFNTSLLAMQEKTRDIGILKTVGMTPGQIMAMINTSAGSLGLVAAMIGVPSGFALTRAVLASLSRAYGFGKVHVRLSPRYAVLLVPVAVLVGVAGSAIPGRWAARLPIVPVLRGQR